jgi:hypothetical protein
MHIFPRLASLFLGPRITSIPHFSHRDVQKRTLLSTCYSMHFLLTSAHVLSGPRQAAATAAIHTDGARQEEAGVKPLCLLIRATAKGGPEKGASCLAAFLNGDEITVGKEVLAAER